MVSEKKMIKFLNPINFCNLIPEEKIVYNKCGGQILKKSQSDRCSCGGYVIFSFTLKHTPFR